MNRFEIINTYTEYISAQLAKQQLEEAGIFSLLKDEHLVTMNWMYGNAIGGIKLMVHEGDMLKAMDVLSLNKNIDDEAPSIPPLDVYEEMELPITNKLCPRCNSKNTSHKDIDKKSAIWSILIVGFPLIFKSKDYLCYHCGYDFKIP